MKSWLRNGNVLAIWKSMSNDLAMLDIGPIINDCRMPLEQDCMMLHSIVAQHVTASANMSDVEHMWMYMLACVCPDMINNVTTLISTNRQWSGPLLDNFAHPI